MTLCQNPRKKAYVSLSHAPCLACILDAWTEKLSHMNWQSLQRTRVQLLLLPTPKDMGAVSAAVTQTPASIIH